MWFWITVGMFFKTVQISVFNFKKKDLWVIPAAIFMGLFMMGKMYGEYDEGQNGDPTIGLAFGFLLVIALYFADRILPRVTEGTLFGYGLAAAYLLVVSIIDNPAGASNFDIFFIILIPVFVSLTGVLVLTPSKVGKQAQTFLMILFVCTNIYIGIMLGLSVLEMKDSPLGAAIIGFSSLIILSHILYLLYFIPLPSKHQSFADRLQKVKEHARAFEEKYIAVDSTRYEVLLTVTSFILMILADYIIEINPAVLVALFLSFVSVVHAPPAKSKFMPMSEYNKL